MADVTLTYQGDTILELSETGNKIIGTGGTYCEADILLEYVKSGGAMNNLLSNLSINNGYWKNGSIVAATASDKEVYTGMFSCSGGDTITLFMQFASSHTFWGAIAFFDANQNWVTRPELVKSTNGSAKHFAVSIVVPSNASYASVMWSTFGLQMDVGVYKELDTAAMNAVRIN